MYKRQVGTTIIIEGKEYQFASDGSWIVPIDEKIAEIMAYTYVPYVSGGASPMGWAVSYTHLDVYKRQVPEGRRHCLRRGI